MVIFRDATTTGGLDRFYMKDTFLKSLSYNIGLPDTTRYQLATPFVFRSMSFRSAQSVLLFCGSSGRYGSLLSLFSQRLSTFYSFSANRGRIRVSFLSILLLLVASLIIPTFIFNIINDPLSLFL